MTPPWVGAPWTPREWQRDALAPAIAAMDAGKAGVVCAVTGAGKSVFLAELAHAMMQRGDGQVVITTPTQKLVRQLTETVRARCGLFNVGAYYQHRKDRDRAVTVTCHPSLSALLATMKAPPTYWIADECHKTEAPTFAMAADGGLKGTRRIGLTATPFRSSEDERLSLWDEIVYRYTPARALRDGVIVPMRVEAWEGAEIAIDQAMVEMISRHARGPGVVNAVSVGDAEAFAERLSQEGHPAEAIHHNLTEQEQAQRLEHLRDGRLRALVYCNLLSEGVDLPWLRWMGLRRPSPTRVRFVQEIGRGLRAAEGKEHCLYLDPNALFSAYDLTYEEALGWSEDAPEAPNGDQPKGQLPIPPRLMGEDAVARTLDGRLVTPLPPADSYCRRILFVFQARGLQRRPIPSGAWRTLKPRPRQLASLRKALLQPRLRKLPPDVKRDLKTLIDNGEQFLRRGSAEDLLEALRACYLHGWPDDAEVEPLRRDRPLSTAFADRRVYFASAWLKSPSAVSWVFCRGNQVIAHHVRVVRSPVREALSALEAHRDFGVVYMDDAWLYKRARGRFKLELIERDANPARAIAWANLYARYPEARAPRRCTATRTAKRR